MSTTQNESLLAVLTELDRIRALTLDLVERERRAFWPAPSSATAQPDATLENLLAGLRRAIFGNPVAAKAVLELLVVEGRRYATTEAGRKLRDDLIASDAVGQLRRIWETVTLNVLDGATTPSGVPEAWSELIADAIAGQSIDDVLARIKPVGLA